MDGLNLIEVVKTNDRSAATELIEAGADVNQQDKQGWTALSWAAGKGDLEMARLLIDKGADALRVGRDQRTPYQIALAAGRVEVAKLLKDVENRTAVQPPARSYAKAYHLSELRQFIGVTKSQAQLKTGTDAMTGSSVPSGDPLVFIHQDLSVTFSMWHNEDVLFDDVTPEWQDFCRNVLCFKVPDDFDLIVPE
jgi:uncharacterized protein